MAENWDLKECFAPAPFPFFSFLPSYYHSLWYSMIIATETISVLLLIEYPLFLKNEFIPRKEITYMKNIQLCTVSVPHNVSLIHTNGPIDFIWVAQAFAVQAFQCQCNNGCMANKPLCFLLSSSTSSFKSLLKTFLSLMAIKCPLTETNVTLFPSFPSHLSDKK